MKIILEEGTKVKDEAGNVFEIVGFQAASQVRDGDGVLNLREPDKYLCKGKDKNGEPIKCSIPVDRLTKLEP